MRTSAKIESRTLCYYYFFKTIRSSYFTGDLNLTFRIFICPLRDVENRKMWIEMDKFAFR